MKLNFRRLLKLYAQVLSSQALKCGEESGHPNEMVGHLAREDSQMSCYFLARGERYVSS